ncbi:alpha-xylosidase [Planctobacterium marinum]|uniref:Alpha-xylosidase n=1 Tax=Planctobacterium marinum TaxID=1631968 RepID=A0AA48KR13_9ALTE|nr:alpha-xylosidase [Planctobacterium marinum]
MSGFTLPVPAWNDIAQLNCTGTAFLDTSGAVIIPSDGGDISISLFESGFRFQIGPKNDYDYGMLKRMPEFPTCEIFGDEYHTSIKAGEKTLEIQHQPFQFCLKHSNKVVQKTPNDGHFVRSLRLPPLAKVDEGWFMAFDLQSDEPVYGLGEKWGKLDKRGQLVRSFNHDALGVNAEISYKNTPFCWSPEGWGVFVHTPAPVTHSVGYAPWSQRAYGVLLEDPRLDVFVFTSEADNVGADMLRQYTELTGRAPIPPEWSLGVILSKAYYKDADELLATAKAVREQGMHCDVITLDGRAWQDTDTRFAFEWDAKRYPDPKVVMDQLKALDFKICIWEYPLVSVVNPLFKKMADKGWLIKDTRTGEAFRYQWDMSAFGEVLTPLPESGIVDFTHPEAFAFWRDAHKPLFDLGVDMIKADFGEQIEDPHMQAHNGETGMALHNVYSLLYNRCVYEAAARYSKNGPFLFSRSAWTGSQCYPAQWGGDPQADWGGLAANVRGGISWGLSGAPFYATDVGGFFKDTRDPELYVRWCQAGVFSAHMRLHGIGQREPWSYGDEARDAANAALSLRYQLLPYLKKYMAIASETGLPVQRAMILAFPDDPAAWPFEDQFMFGDDILVAPVYRSGGKVTVYLPHGDWQRLDNRESFTGGRVLKMHLALKEIAVFVRAGAELQLAKPVTHLNELSIDELELESW